MNDTSLDQPKHHRYNHSTIYMRTLQQHIYCYAKGSSCMTVYLIHVPDHFIARHEPRGSTKNMHTQQNNQVKHTRIATQYMFILQFSYILVAGRVGFPIPLTEAKGDT